MNEQYPEWLDKLILGAAVALLIWALIAFLVAPPDLAYPLTVPPLGAACLFTAARRRPFISLNLYLPFETAGASLVIITAPVLLGVWREH